MSLGHRYETVSGKIYNLDVVEMANNPTAVSGLFNSYKRDKVMPGSSPASFCLKTFEIFPLYDLRVIAQQGKHRCL